MVELDKPVTMANYVFILLSTMMTSIAFNHVILRGLFKESDPIKDLNFLYKNKVKMESLAEQMRIHIDKSENDDAIKAKKAYDEVLKAYKKYVNDANNNNNNLYHIFPNFTFNGTGYPLSQKYVCNSQPNIGNNCVAYSGKYFEDVVQAKYNEITGKIGEYEITEAGLGYKAGDTGTLKVTNTIKPGNYFVTQVDKGKIIDIKLETTSGFSIGEIVKLIPDSKNVAKDAKDAKIKVLSLADSFTNTGNEGFEGKYELTDEGQFKDKEYTQNITNGSIAVYIFAVLISITGLIYHTHAYHIMGAVINMAIAGMGLHLWILYHDKKDNLAEIDKSYMENIILASWVLCLITLTVFIFIYVHNDDSSF